MTPFNSPYGFSVGSGSTTVIIDSAGNLSSTASFALTASYALNGGGGSGSVASETLYGEVYVISNGIFMP